MEGLNITKCPNLYIKHAIKPRIDNTSGAIGVSRYGNGKYRSLYNCA